MGRDAGGGGGGMERRMLPGVPSWIFLARPMASKPMAVARVGDGEGRVEPGGQQAGVARGEVADLAEVVAQERRREQRRAPGEAEEEQLAAEAHARRGGVVGAQLEREAQRGEAAVAGEAGERRLEDNLVGPERDEDRRAAHGGDPAGAVGRGGGAHARALGCQEPLDEVRQILGAVRLEGALQAGVVAVGRGGVGAGSVPGPRGRRPAETASRWASWVVPHASQRLPRTGKPQFEQKSRSGLGAAALGTGASEYAEPRPGGIGR